MISQTGPQSILNSSLQDPEIINRQFHFKGKTICYENKAQIIEVPDKGKGYFKVHNFLCQKQHQRLLKITEILFQDRIIRITDQLYPMKQQIVQARKKYQKKQKTPNNNYFNMIGDSFIVTKQCTSELRNRNLSKLYRNVLKMYIGWLNCFENLSIEKNIMKNIIKTSKKYTFDVIDKMKKRPNIVDSFKKFIDCNSQNLHNISKQNSKQNYVQGTKMLVEMLDQRKVRSSTKKIILQTQLQNMQNQGISTVSGDANLNNFTEKKEVESLTYRSDRLKTSYSLT